MSIGYIDSASLHGVIAALTYSSIESWPAWTSNAAIATTGLLATNPLLRVEVAASPSPYVGACGLYDHMRLALTSTVVADSKPEHSVTADARQRLRRWTRRNLARVKQIWQDTEEDSSFAEWLDWSIKHAWIEHAMMHNGLFDPAFVPELAILLNCSEPELHRILELSQNPREVAQWVREDLNEPICELAVQAYVISALLRGRFHDHLAEAQDLLIMHHPLRDRILAYKSKNVAFVATDSEVFFIKILLFSALCEKRIEDRISLWADNIVKTRLGLDKVDLRQRDSEAKAIEAARETVKKLNLRVHPRRVTKAIDISADVATGSLITVLCWWSGVPLLESSAIGILGDVGIRESVKELLRDSMGSKVAARLYGRAKRLSNLATAGPGRIERANK